MGFEGEKVGATKSDLEEENEDEEEEEEKKEDAEEKVKQERLAELEKKKAEILKNVTTSVNVVQAPQ
ncbi:hypothetical protein N7462_009460 [Penicillium macrosclerotiorum]|uniref:uncharacterized protein n=1 Tax=Penicillium macrosclerotiorum TaxID=303699 RepID=UPI0025485EE3|nr:uncharacterized protein N7462_009460 [Penicillium macrosclerotiorum]KAJ5674021.1 hypothetical protein N7462_009460 [Penicillium macrosclerotiorum]